MPPPLIPSSKLTALSVRLLHPFYSHDVRLEKIGKSGKTVLCRFFYLFSPDNTRDHELTYAIKLRYKVQLHISISLESTIDGKKKKKKAKGNVSFEENKFDAWWLSCDVRTGSCCAACGER